MHFRVLRPVAVVAALALTLSAGLAPTTASAQVFGPRSTHDQNQRQVVGTVTYFSQFDLRISNGNGQYGNGQYGNGRYGNGNANGQGQQHRRHRHRDNDDQNGQGQNGQYGNGQYPNGQQYPNGGQQYPNGQNGNGRYGTNGQYNGSEQRIHLHQGTVINPRGTTLQNGMQIRVSGHPNSDGTFEADRIDVVNGQNGQGQGYYRH